MRQLIIIFVISLCCISIRPGMAALKDVPIDMQAAIDYIDAYGAGGLDGIWEYPGDGIIVMITADQRERYRYNVTVIESDDVRLKPGMLIGTLTESAQNGKYRLSLYTSVKHGLPARLSDCLATLSKDNQSLIVESLKVKVRVGGSTILPVFWNKLRLSLRINVNNPLDKLPDGMRRIYPAYDGNGSSPYKPRTL